MRYQFVETAADPRKPWRVSTLAYRYRLSYKDQEILSMHWHPVGPSHYKLPHIHVHTAALNPDGLIKSNHHLATWRMAFEAMVRTMIELGVKPKCEDWSERLERSESLFYQFRTWH